MWSLHEDALGSLWVGTYGGGIARLRGSRFESLTTGNGLSNDFVRALHTDREGSLWIGTYSGGLCRLRDGKFTTYTTREGLSYDFVRTALEDRRGDLWVGTTGGGLCRMRGGTFSCLGPREGLAPDVRAADEDEGGALWVGTLGRGPVPHGRGSPQAFTSADGLPHPSVTAIIGDGEGGSGSAPTGRPGRRTAKERFTYLRTRRTGSRGNLVLTVLQDRGRLGLGGHRTAQA